MFLTRAASPNNLGVTAQFIPILAMWKTNPRLLRNGGGLPYPRFHAFIL